MADGAAASGSLSTKSNSAASGMSHHAPPSFPAPPGRPAPLDRFKHHHRVVVRLHGVRIDCRSREQGVARGPVALKITRLDGGLMQASLENAVRRRQTHPLSILESEPLEIVAADKDGVAAGAGQRIYLALNPRIELLATPRRDEEVRARQMVGPRPDRVRAFDGRLRPQPYGNESRLGTLGREPAIG